MSKQKVRANLFRQLHEVLIVPCRASATIDAWLCVLGYVRRIPADAEAVPIDAGGGVVRFAEAFPRREGLGNDGMVGAGDQIGSYDGCPDVGGKATHVLLRKGGIGIGRGGRGEVGRKEEGVGNGGRRVGYWVILNVD